MRLPTFQLLAIAIHLGCSIFWAFDGRLWLVSMNVGLAVMNFGIAIAIAPRSASKGVVDNG